MFWKSLKAENPDIELPIYDDTVLSTDVVLDIIQFCYENIAKPEIITYHYFYKHNHFKYDGHL